MFQSQFSSYTYKNDKAIRMKDYALPGCLHDRVSLVMNLIDMPFDLQKESRLSSMAASKISSSSSPSSSCTSYPAPQTCQIGSTIYASPYFINKIYNIKSNTGSSKVSQGIIIIINSKKTLLLLRYFSNHK
jgi:hypothetical protein